MEKLIVEFVCRLHAEYCEKADIEWKNIKFKLEPYIHMIWYAKYNSFLYKSIV